MPAVPAGVREASAQQDKPRNAPTQLSRGDRVKLLVKLVTGKGPAALAELQRKIKGGQELSAKGITWDVDMLKEAVATVSAGANTQGAAKSEPGQAQPQRAGAPVPTPTRAAAPRPELAAASAPAGPSAQPAPAAPSGAAPSGNRWAVAAPTASALVRRAQAESEGVESFARVAKNTGDNKVAVLVKPNVLSQATGEYVLPGEEFEVIARCARVPDGRTYLRLKRSTGWVCTRSRKDFWRIVICGTDGASLEPPGCAAEFDSRAARVLPRVDAEGRRVDAQGRPQEAEAGAEPPEARSFRVAGGRALPILGLPSLEAATPGAMLQAREAFLADAVSVAPADGRAYLRLKDGRGWVSERLRADFQRYAVEPEGHPQDLDVPRARRSVVCTAARGERDPREAAAEGPGVEEPVAARPARGPALRDEAVVFRSDSSLWPRRLGPPRPIGSETRVALRRLANLHGRRVAECEEDLREVEGRAEAYTRACDGKRLLLAHAEALRKEVAKAERAWQAAVEEAVAGAQPGPAPEPAAERGAQGAAVAAVVPVQVQGRAWHCAVVRAAGPGGDGEAGAAAAHRRLGPLRPEAALAANDLRVLEAVLERELAGGPCADAEGQVPSKRPRRSRGAEDAEAAEGGQGD